MNKTRRNKARKRRRANCMIYTDAQFAVDFYAYWAGCLQGRFIPAFVVEAKRRGVDI